MSPEPTPAAACGTAPADPVLPWPVVLGLPLLLCLPLLALSHLPQTDAPQHLAVASMLLHMDDPAFGFATFYELDFGRTLYWLPYGLTLALATLLPLEPAAQVVVFGAALGYPLSLMRLLRVLGKPRALALCGLPVALNAAFFWGFTSFNLALSLSVLALSFLLQARRSGGETVALALTCGVLVLTHVYGIALVLGAFVLAAVLGPPWRRRRDWLPLLPAAVGAVIWPLPGDDVTGAGLTEWPTPLARIADFPQEVLGAHQNRAEVVLLVLLLGGFGLLAGGRALAVTRRRWRALSWQERVLLLAVLGNLLLYMVVPRHTPGAKFVHFRHGVIALALLPALLPAVVAGWQRAARPVVLLLLALGAVTVAWVQLWRFDREAASFDDIAARMPPRPRVLSLILDPHGEVMATHPYLHFAALIQARKGGLISTSFARFWNIPVRLRPSDAPSTPAAFEWRPGTFDIGRFGSYFTYVLVRTSRSQTFRRGPRFPYTLIARSGPWQLYRVWRRPPGSSFREACGRARPGRPRRPKFVPGSGASASRRRSRSRSRSTRDGHGPRSTLHDAASRAADSPAPTVSREPWSAFRDRDRRRDRDRAFRG